jgi:hypothetical protein
MGTLSGCARFGFEVVPGLSDDGGPARPADAQAPAGTVDSGAPDAPPPDPKDGGGPPSDPRDGGIEAGTSLPDAGGLEPRCLAFGPFDPPTLVAGLAQSVSIGPALSDDALTLLYVSNNPYDIFIATRPDPSSPFSSGELLPGINLAGADVTPFSTDGGLTLLFASDRLASPGQNDLMIATRPSLEVDFGSPQPIANVNSSAVELLPHRSADGLRLYFSSDRVNADRDIWLSTRPSRADEFSTPARVTELSSSAADFGPTLSDDELEVFIASDRPGGQGMDLWRAVRPDQNAPFGTPENVAPLNGPAYETDPRLSPDRTELFFSSSRNGNQVLWASRRACVDFEP